MTSGSTLAVQHGGSHYKNKTIQPVEFWAANGWDGFSSAILKYIVRWRDKNGVEDLLKAQHFADLRMELRGAIKVKRTMSMFHFCKSNQVGELELAALLALEAWIGAGLAGNDPKDLRYRLFAANMNNLIERAQDGY